MLEKTFSVLRPQSTQILVFDAWSHDGDPLRRVFLEELTQLCIVDFKQTTKEEWDVRKKKQITGREIERDQTTTPVLKSKWPILVLLIASLYPIAIVALGVLLRQNDPSQWILYLIAVCVFVSVAPALGFLGLFIYLCIKRTKDGLEKAGNLISLWSKKIDETTKMTSHEGIGPTSIEFQSYFSDLIKAYLDQSERRLVIVLDNLDRVPESTARTLWATLRLFADCCDNDEEWSKHIWFIVPYDREAAAMLWDEDREHAARRDAGAEQEMKVIQRTESKQLDSAEGTIPKLPSISAAFLDKSFQVRFVVPPLHIADWEHYLTNLVERAMPGFGSVEERHRVYRLSERLADEKGRPPPPRHLKLYVNDIGALVRQFGSRFPIDQLALYTIQRRQGRDIRLWIASGAFKHDPLTQVMPDNRFVATLTRSRYEVQQARKQYAAVDPDHRLVARELERRWDEALRADEQLQADYVRFQQDSPTQLSPQERQQILSLAEDLPALWRADSTTPEDRQTIARLLLEQVTVTVEGNTDCVDVQLRWAGGFVSQHMLARPVQTYQQLSNYDELLARIEALRGQRTTLSQIAATLNAEGFHPPKRTMQFTKGILSNLLRERRASLNFSCGDNLEQHLQADEWWLADLASELSMPIATLHRWQRVGWVTSRKVTTARGRWAIYADAPELERLRQLLDAPRGWPRPYPTELITPKRRPDETETTSP